MIDKLFTIYGNERRGAWKNLVVRYVGQPEKSDLIYPDTSWWADPNLLRMEEYELLMMWLTEPVRSPVNKDTWETRYSAFRGMKALRYCIVQEDFRGLNGNPREGWLFNWNKEDRTFAFRIPWEKWRLGERYFVELEDYGWIDVPPQMGLCLKIPDESAIVNPENVNLVFNSDFEELKAKEEKE